MTLDLNQNFRLRIKSPKIVFGDLIKLVQGQNTSMNLLKEIDQVMQRFHWDLQIYEMLKTKIKTVSFG